MRPIRAFLDPSALCAAIWSAEGGGRFVLRLAEAGAVQPVVSLQVLAELEGALRRKVPDSLVSLALLLDRVGLEIAPDPGPTILQGCEALVVHRGDAMILAAAVGASVEFLMTLDRRHFVDNAQLGAAMPFRIGTPGDFLSWVQGRLLPSE